MPRDDDRPGRRPDATVEQPEPEPGVRGLLDRIVTGAVDEDYARVAAQPARERSSGRSRLVTTGAVLAVFGVLVGASALRTREDASTVDQQHTALVEAVHEQQGRLDADRTRLESLQTDVTALSADLDGLQDESADSTRGLGDLRLAAATTPVRGPGIVVTVDDAPGAISTTSDGFVRDSDVQSLVNGLWEAGAEAVSINDNRIGPLTSIRYAGEAITVNYRSLVAPYRIEVVGDRDTMPARLAETTGGQLLTLLKQSYGITYTVTTDRALTLPATSRSGLEYAGAAGGAR